MRIPSRCTAEVGGKIRVCSLGMDKTKRPGDKNEKREEEE